MQYPGRLPAAANCSYPRSGCRMLAVIGRAAAGLALLAVTGCATTGGESGKMSLAPPSWLGGKREHTTQISGPKPGPYEASSLAGGEEKDSAQRRGERVGFWGSGPIQRYPDQRAT